MRPFKFFKDNKKCSTTSYTNDIFVLVRDIDGEDFGVPYNLYLDIQNVGKQMYDNPDGDNRVSGEHSSYSFNVDNIWTSDNGDLHIYAVIMVDHIPIRRMVELTIASTD